MKSFFDTLFQNGVSPNGLLVLQMLQTGVNYPNYINSGTEEYRLLLSGFLVKVLQPETQDWKLSLSDKGEKILLDAHAAMHSGEKTKKVTTIPFETWEPEIKTYLAMFPAGNQGSAPIRSPAKTLHPRFVWFFQQFPEYSWLDVHYATDAYLKSLEAGVDGFKFLSTAKYFIKKQENGGKTDFSRLADWCLAVKEGTLQEMSGMGFANFTTETV